MAGPESGRGPVRTPNLQPKRFGNYAWADTPIDSLPSPVLYSVIFKPGAPLITNIPKIVPWKKDSI